MRPHGAALPIMTVPAEAHAAEAEAAWVALVRAHGPMLYRVAYSVVRSGPAADDVVQEALLRAWRYRDRLAQVEAPAAWLARIVWRVAVQHRPRQWMQALDQIEPVAGGLSVEELAKKREMQALLNRLIERLPAKLRRPLVLSTIEELSAREVGAILGISEALVRKRTMRARALLRAKWRAWMEHDVSGR